MLISRGFTFIELVVTVALVGVLASATLPLLEVTLQRNKEIELRHSLRQIRQAIDAYKLAVDEGRISRRADESGYPPTLQTLVEGVADMKSATRAKIYFLRRLPRDPMSSDRNVSAEETWGKRSYASPPDAPESGTDVFDVYSRATTIGLNGVQYRLW